MKRMFWIRNLTFHAVCAALALTGFQHPARAQDAPKDEASLIAVISGSAGWQEKFEACRALREVGTANAVPALAVLLRQEDLSHMARYALESMAYPEAGTALREALGSTSGTIRVGVMTSLGVRGDETSVRLLAELMEDSDEATSAAASAALGRIATHGATKALLDYSKEAPESRRTVVAEGLLVATQRAVERGEGNRTVSVYKALSNETWPMHVRMGAFDGIVRAQPGKAADRLIDAIEGDDAVFREMAAQLVAEHADKGVAKPFVRALPKLPAAGQVVLLGALAGRGDLEARDAIRDAMSNDSVDVRLAAIAATGTLGDEHDLAQLTALMVADDPKIAAAARSSLETGTAPQLDEVLADAIQVGTGAASAARLEILTARRADQAVPLAVACLKDPERTVRIQAFNTLGVLGGKDETPALIQALDATSDTDDRAVGAQAIAAIASFSREEVLPAMIEAMPKVSGETRRVLLGTFDRIGGASALTTVVAALGEADPAIRQEAVRVMANWPTSDAGPHLLTLIQGKDTDARAAAFAGYARLARDEKSLDAKTAMLDPVAKLAKSKEEKWQLISAWATLPTPHALDKLLPHLRNAEVRNEAAVAIIAVAGEVGKGDEAAKKQAADALRQVSRRCDSETMRARAQEALTAITG